MHLPTSFGTAAVDAAHPVRSRILSAFALPAALALFALLVLSGCSSSDDAASSAGSDGASAAPATSCEYPADSSGAAKKVDPPASEPTVKGQVDATIDLNAGELKVTLDADSARCTVNSFMSLAEQGYFDKTDCHRLTTEGIFVLQCGDPTGTGTGGPGYSFADETNGSETYPAGTLAMANAGPDTNGSQFFIVYADSKLPPDYTVFGHLDEASVGVVRAIAEKGTADGSGDGAPKDPVSITKVS